MYHSVLMTKNEEEFFIKDQSCHQVWSLRVWTHPVVIVLQYAIRFITAEEIWSGLGMSLSHSQHSMARPRSVSCCICFVTPRNILTRNSQTKDNWKPRQIEQTKNHKKGHQLYLFALKTQFHNSHHLRRKDKRRTSNCAMPMQGKIQRIKYVRDRRVVSVELCCLRCFSGRKSRATVDCHWVLTLTQDDHTTSHLPDCLTHNRQWGGEKLVWNFPVLSV